MPKRTWLSIGVLRPFSRVRVKRPGGIRYNAETGKSPMKHLVYFSDLTHTGLGINAHTYPLGLGSVAAYAGHELGDDISVKLFKFPDQLDAVLHE